MRYRVRFAVQATADRAVFDQWRDEAAQGAVKDAFQMALRDRMGEIGETVLLWQGLDSATPVSFMWMCPGCGGTYGGNLGEQPAGGWDAPCWANSGTLERPTLTPSLGCPRWRDGTCRGHWWLRDGVLEQVPSGEPAEPQDMSW